MVFITIIFLNINCSLKETAMIKIFTLLSLLAAIIIPSVSQSNLNVTKKINPKEKYSISIRESTNEIKELVKSFDIFDYKISNKHYYVCDVLNPESVQKKLKKIVINTSPSEIDGLPFNYSAYTDKTIIEIVEEKNNTNSTEYFYADKSFGDYIESIAMTIDKESLEFERICTSFNYLISEKQKNNKNAPASDYSYNASISLLDSQASLEHFIKTKEVRSEEMTNEYIKPNETEPNNYYYYIDNPITTIIPKYLFTQQIAKFDFGIEWGYYINTVQGSNSNEYISSVLIIDLTQIRGYNSQNDQIQIKVIHHSNYKYILSQDAVIYYGENNYCIGNPIIESQLHYVAANDNLNNSITVNPEDSNYSMKNDKGFSFGAANFKLIGIGKQRDNKIEAYKSYIVNVCSTIIDFVTNSLELSFASSLAISKISDFAINSLLSNYEAPVKNANIVTNSNGLYEYNYTLENSYDNIITAAQFSALKKYVCFYLQNRGDTNNKFNSNATNIETNHQTPILFKNDSHSINYSQNIISSEQTENYVASISHRLQFDVFIDDTTLFKFDPSFIGRYETGWSYLLGKDVCFSEKTYASKKDLYVATGTHNPQVIIFSPQVTAYYDIVLTKSSDLMRLSEATFGDIQLTEYREEFENVWGTTLSNGYHSTFKGRVRLTSGNTYRFQIKRIHESNQYYGTCIFNIYQLGTDLGDIYNSNIASSQDKYINQNISYNKTPIINRLYSSKSELYSISANHYQSNSLDTYLLILDSKYRVLAISDDNYGNRDAGLLLRINSNNNIYIVTHLYNMSSSGTYGINVAKASIIPTLTFDSNTNSFGKIIIDFSKYNSRLYLFSLPISCTVNMFVERIPYYISTISIETINREKLYEQNESSSASYISGQLTSGRVYFLYCKIYNNNSTYAIDIDKG